MRVCSSCSHQDGFYFGVFLEVEGESLFHGEGIAGESEVVGFGGEGDEMVDFGERVRRDYVDGGEKSREGRRWRRRGGGVGGRGMFREYAEEEDEQDETVFAAIVGKRDFFEAGNGLSASFFLSFLSLFF